MPPTVRREEECKSSKYSFLPIEGFLSLCELVMTLSSHQIIVSWKERSSSVMPVNLIFFSSSSKYLSLSVNLRSVLICYTTLVSLTWSLPVFKKSGEKSEIDGIPGPSSDSNSSSGSRLLEEDVETC